MAVNEDISAYATTAASNTPAGSANVGPDLDNHLRDIKRNIRRATERFQGPTAPEAFRGRAWLDTSSTASTKIVLKINDGSNEVSLVDIDTSAGTSRPYLAGTVVPTDSLAAQSKDSISGSAFSITTLTASGNVTITGTLGVTGAPTFESTTRYRGDGDNALCIGDSYTDTASQSAQLLLRRARGSVASPTAIQSGDIAGIIAARPYDDAGFTGSNLGQLRWVATENHTAANHGVRAELFTTPKSSETPTLALTIDDDQSATFAAGIKVAGSVTNTISTLANDATPSVSGGRTFLTGGTTTITDFDDGVTGQEIIIMSEHAITITDGTNIFLNGSANFVMASSDSLHLIQKADGFWYEIGRSVN